MKITRTTCPGCGVGCGVATTCQGNGILAVAGDPAHRANAGKFCTNGRDMASTQELENRLVYPEVNGERVSWQSAIGAVAGRFRQVIRQHGPQSVAFYLSGALLTEDYYVANKLMKGYLGSANVDSSARLSTASAVAAHRRAFGEDVVPCDYADLERCELLILCGSNVAWTHPILHQRIVAAKQQRGTKVVVIDPRTTSTCDVADMHLALSPGTDGALFNGLLTYLYDRDVLDNAFIDHFTQGLSGALDFNTLSVAETSSVTGLPIATLRTFYELYANTPRTVTMFGQGINQSVAGTDTANAIINCHLATGRIGLPGTGPFSVTGQSNAMGAREVGGSSEQLAAHMGFDPDHVDRVARFWRAPRIAGTPGLTAVDMFEALACKEIKAIWIMGSNPALSLPDSKRVCRALAECENVIVSDCVSTSETATYADILLPAAAWGEKDGTVTNSERCISRQRKFAKAPGEARPDWKIVCDVAAELGFAKPFSFSGPWQIFSEHARLTAFENHGEHQLDLGFLSQLSKHSYDVLEPVAWPASKPFADYKFSTANGRARFVATPHQLPVERPDSLHPLVLNSGRLRGQPRITDVADAPPGVHAPGQALQINPQDAEILAVSSDGLVEVHNGRGRAFLVAEVTEATPPGQLYAPIQWGTRSASSVIVSQLFSAVTDPVSGQPESKHAVVACAPVEVGLWARLVHRERIDPARFKALFGIRYWASASAVAGWQYEFALDELPALLDLIGRDDAVEARSTNGQSRWFGGSQSPYPWLLYAGAQRRRLPAFTQIYRQLNAEGPAWSDPTKVGANKQTSNA